MGAGAGDMGLAAGRQPGRMLRVVVVTTQRDSSKRTMGITYRYPAPPMMSPSVGVSRSSLKWGFNPLTEIKPAYK